MSDHIFIQCCSPTLAGIKAGNMFSVEYGSKAAFNRELAAFNARFRSLGLRIVPLRWGGSRVLVYLYRPEALRAAINNDQAAQMLRELGYTPENVERCVARLVSRMRSDPDPSGFPHEVGLFLDYPPEDVKGFMTNTGTGYKEVGFWKVYGDANAARKRFNSFRRCSKVYSEQFRRGRTLEQLIVRGKEKTI